MSADLLETPQHWERTTLGEVCRRAGGDIQTGPFGSQLHASDYVPVGIPSIMPQDIRADRISDEDIARILPKDAARLSKYLVRSGDIVFSRRGDVERRALAETEHDGWLCGTGCLRIRLGSGVVDSKFAYYYFGHPEVRAWIVRHAVGATMPNLNTEIMSAVPFVVPPHEEQRRIAEILGTLDEKIELNRRMNRTLEEMARASFKSWFVDFDPVHAKSAGCLPSALDPATAALFPDSFEDSPLGKIPKGWSVMPLDEIADFLNGLALQKFPPKGDAGDLPVIKIAELRRGNTIGSDKANRDIPDPYVVNDGDVLFSWSGTLVVTVWCAGRGALNQHLFKVTSGEYPRWFYLHWLYEHLPEFQSIAADKATTMGHIQRRHLTAARVVVPPPALLTQATRHFEPLISRQIESEKESRSLTTLRDTLLPRLLSGELSVKAAEKEVPVWVH